MGMSSEREEEQGRTGEGAGRGSACAKTKGWRRAWRAGDSAAGSGRVGDRVRGTTRLAAAERRSDALISEGPRQYGNVNEDMSAGQAERAEGERHACTGQT